MRGDGRSFRLILFVAATLVLTTGSFWGVPAGKSVAGALTILDGGVPYRDFWTMYAPGQFYVVAALFWVFGRELLVQAIAVSVIRAGAALVFMGLLRRLGVHRGAAFVLAAVFVLMFWTTAPELTDYPLALFFLLLALDRVARHFSKSDTIELRWAGLWIGLAAWFKHDIAAYVAIGITISLFVSRLVSDRDRAGRPSALWATLTFATAAAAVVTPLALWTALSAGADAWHDLFVFPATVFSKVFSEPFPPLIPDPGPLLSWFSTPTNVRRALTASRGLSTWVSLYAPICIFVGGIAVLVVARRRLAFAAVGRLVLFLTCMPFFWSAAHVQQNTHPYSLAILGCGVTAVVWSQLNLLNWKPVLNGPLLAAVVVYVGALLATPTVKAALIYYEHEGSRVLSLPGFRGIRVPARLYESYQPIGEFFRAHTREGEPIYTGLLRHDSIVINNTLLYAIAGRPACCGYTELHPGVGDRVPVQREIVERLENGNVRAIALWEFGGLDTMEAVKRRTMAEVADAGSTLLDRYIADNFRTVETHGEYRVLWRRNLPLKEGVAYQGVPPSAPSLDSIVHAGP